MKCILVFHWCWLVKRTFWYFAGIEVVWGFFVFFLTKIITFLIIIHFPQAYISLRLTFFRNPIVTYWIFLLVDSGINIGHMALVLCNFNKTVLCSFLLLFLPHKIVEYRLKMLLSLHLQHSETSNGGRWCK